MRACLCSRRELAYCKLTLMIDVSSQLRLVFYVALNSCLFFFADMNSLDWVLPMGKKSRDG